MALSRATTQQGLQVLRFRKDKVMAHPRVISFYNKLYSVETAMQEGGPPASVSSKSFALGTEPRPPAPVKSRPMTVLPYAGFDEDFEEASAAYG